MPALNRNTVGLAARCPGLEAPQGRTDPGGERCQVVWRTEQEAAGHQAASWRKMKGKLKGSRADPPPSPESPATRDSLHWPISTQRFPGGLAVFQPKAVSPARRKGLQGKQLDVWNGPRATMSKQAASGPLGAQLWKMVLGRSRS